MSSLSTTVDTINAAASAIVSADSRPLPSSSTSPVQKRRWGGCWSQYWCFGFHKQSKRITDAIIPPAQTQQSAPHSSSSPSSSSLSHNQTHSTAIILPFVAPPSSPASFLQSDPPSAALSPPPPPLRSQVMFTVGPYADETQLVTPPAFSAFTTEPSTASFTPPPESVLITTPSSPDVPFAQLLTSSLERAARRNSGGINHKFKYVYPGSPGGQIISPGSVASDSGTSSPFPDKKHLIIQFPVGENPKLFGFEHFGTRKWGSRLGSGSMTPDGVGLGSRIASGSITPDGVGLGSRLASGAVTPDGAVLGSRLGSGSLTPDCVVVPASQVGLLLENQVSEIASLANSENGSRSDENLVHHRVSFELSGEEVARCLENKSASSSRTIFSEFPDEFGAEDPKRNGAAQISVENGCAESSTEAPEKPSGESEEEHSYKKHRFITLGSFKEFNFDSSKGQAPDKAGNSSKWWANETISGNEPKTANNWSFFPLLAA